MYIYIYTYIPEAKSLDFVTIPQPPRTRNAATPRCCRCPWRTKPRPSGGSCCLRGWHSPAACGMVRVFSSKKIIGWWSSKFYVNKKKEAMLDVPVWWCMMICDDLWWFMMIYDDVWWCLMMYLELFGIREWGLPPFVFLFNEDMLMNHWI